MNHDACHCLDYKKGKCPKSCYRAKLTQDYLELKAAGKVDFFTTWAHLGEHCRTNFKRKGGE